MKLVVDIPEEKLKSLKKCLETGCALGMTDIAVLNGVPLITCKECGRYHAPTHWCLRGSCLNVGPDDYCSCAIKED